MAGFSDAKRRSPHFAATFQGLYWALYNSGSQAAHPKIGTLWECFATELAYFDGKKARIHPERATADRIDFTAEVVAYLVGYAVVISHHAFGWPDIDAALRLAGRYEDVRSPELLAAEIDAIVGDKNGRRWALTGTPLSVERHDRHLAAVVPVPGGYMRLDRLADRAWKLTARAPNTSGKDLRDSPQASLESAIRSVRSLIAQVGDVGWTDAEPSAWPDDAP